VRALLHNRARRGGPIFVPIVEVRERCEALALAGFTGCRGSGLAYRFRRSRSICSGLPTGPNDPSWNAAPGTQTRRRRFKRRMKCADRHTKAPFLHSFGRQGGAATTDFPGTQPAASDRQPRRVYRCEVLESLSPLSPLRAPPTP
jgi:hypothetical protein